MTGCAVGCTCWVMNMRHFGQFTVLTASTAPLAETCQHANSNLLVRHKLCKLEDLDCITVLEWGLVPAVTKLPKVETDSCAWP